MWYEAYTYKNDLKYFGPFVYKEKVGASTETIVSSIMKVANIPKEIAGSLENVVARMEALNQCGLPCRKVSRQLCLTKGQLSNEVGVNQLLVSLLGRVRIPNFISSFSYSVKIA